ncbi:MAG TPA: ATPase, T2SS/T4P/T4SS family [Candidatus Thermoplasmatota archaeon]|nr:ATPase, T2SS/T4P/T4SS family [Candidatus Thermoplasmatota archaeon]
MKTPPKAEKADKPSDEQAPHLRADPPGAPPRPVAEVDAPRPEAPRPEEKRRNPLAAGLLRRGPRDVPGPKAKAPAIGSPSSHESPMPIPLGPSHPAPAPRPLPSPTRTPAPASPSAPPAAHAAAVHPAPSQGVAAATPPPEPEPAHPASPAAAHRNEATPSAPTPPAKEDRATRKARRKEEKANLPAASPPARHTEGIPGRKVEEPPVRKGEDTPTRKAEAGDALTTDKAAISSGRRDIGADRAASIDSAVQRRAVTPTAKLPEFPAAVVERPEELKREEARRTAIRAHEAERRARLREQTKDEIVLRKLEAEWAAEDALEYRIDPDDVELEIYPINPPYGYVQVIRNQRTHEVLYHVIEPKLTHDEALLLGFIEQTLVDVLDLQPSELDKEELGDYIRKKFDSVVEDYSIRLGDEESTEEESRDRLLYYVLRDFIGEGPLDVFSRDPMIEDISCDGPHQPIFIYHRKYESLTTSVRFRGHEVLDSFVIRLAQRAGKHVSIAEPILDATMRDGSRLQATLAKEVSTFGSTFTIRKFREVPFTPIDLVRFGTMSSQMLAYLWMIIANRQSAIYSGGTASGKTTAINAIMLFIPPALKVITIEDTRELNIPQPNWIAGLTRGGFGPRDAHGRQAGEIDMFQLLKNALRQRPEFIIVGEVRGAEAYNLFQAMATGHAAYGTMHADSVDAVIHRLESDPINIPRALLEALDVVAVQIQTRVGGKRVRRTKQITEIVGLDPNTREILTNEVFHWEPGSDQFIFSGVSYSLERIAAETGLDSEQVMAEMDDRRRVIEWMVQQQIREYKLVAHIITIYFYDKKAVMAKVDGGLPWQD